MKYRIFIPHREKVSKSRKKIYYLEYRFDPMPTAKRISLGTTDRRVAERNAGREFERLQQTEAGLLPKTSVLDGAAKPLGELLETFFQDLTARKRSMATVRKYRMILPKLFKACGWNYLRDVEQMTFTSWRSRTELEPKTHNLYLGAAKGFFNWMVKNKLARENPLDGADTVTLSHEDKYRRSLTHEELNKLIQDAPDIRAFIYRVLYYTGLRHNEANGLTCADFLLDKQEPVILIPASLAKNRRSNLIEVAPALHEELRAFLSPFKPTDRPFFGHIPKMTTLKKDLSRAGIAFETEQGRFDLHAFRKTLGTHLAMAGEPPQKVQRILRHESLAMTMKFYTDVSLLNSRESLAKLPLLEKRKEAIEAPAGGSAQKDSLRPLMARFDNDGLGGVTLQPPENEPSRLELAPTDTTLKMVGLERFELSTSCTPCKRATRLRYSPFCRTEWKMEDLRWKKGRAVLDELHETSFGW
jgi:integrase